MKNKKGLSAIVATLLIILLAIIAFSIVSVVIRNTVGNSAEKIDLGQKCLNIEIHSTGITKYVGTNYYDIGFTRTNSGETIDGMKVVLTDSNDEIIKEDLVKEIEPLSKWTENMSFTDGQDFIPAKITMIPYFMKASGDIYYCEGGFYTDEINLVNETSNGGSLGANPSTGGVIAPLTGNNVILLNINVGKAEDPNAALGELNAKYKTLNLDKLANPLNLNTPTNYKSLSTPTEDSTQNCYSTELNKVLKNCASSLSSSTDLTVTKTATTSCNEDCYKQGISYALQVCDPNYVPIESFVEVYVGQDIITVDTRDCGGAYTGAHYTWDGLGCEADDYDTIGQYTSSACCGH